MSREVQFKSDRLAVLIDADNANADLIEALLKEIAKYGTSHVKRIYGDWTNTQLGKWKDKLNKFAIQPMQQFRYTTGKNATDSALIIDAMDLLYTHNFDGFCIVSSDSDFTRLASRIRESGLVVYGFGEKKTPLAFISACDKFIYTEILGQPKELASSNSADSPVEKDPKSLIKDSSSQKPEALDSQKLKRDRELVGLLKDAYKAIAEEDGWANLGPFGAQLTKISPSFDQRNYGYEKLGSLIRATDLFEVKEIPHDKNPAAKQIHIKFKS
ncbi:Maebl [Stenomitos frigidus ULC18]|uniref:Maebl n=1 Tax=Stenomitos frigidus ULC18 TaxID=2107698 RepID=A0A2T1EEQ7_9CYAN|nr:Maebl [Stenomitos frigidus ULC18]